MASLISGLSNLTSLESLWLGKNKITNIVGLETLKNVRKLDVQSNRLTSVEGLTGQVEKLEEVRVGERLFHNSTSITI